MQENGLGLRRYVVKYLEVIHHISATNSLWFSKSKQIGRKRERDRQRGQMIIGESERSSYYSCNFSVH